MPMPKIEGQQSKILCCLFLFIVEDITQLDDVDCIFDCK